MGVFQYPIRTVHLFHKEQRRNFIVPEVRWEYKLNYDVVLASKKALPFNEIKAKERLYFAPREYTWSAEGFLQPLPTAHCVHTH